MNQEILLMLLRGEINFFSNPRSEVEEFKGIINNDSSVTKFIEEKTKKVMIPRLTKLGVTLEQISEIVELSIEEVKNVVSQCDH